MGGERVYAVYIVTNTRRGVLYTGVTSDMPTRGHQHRQGLLDGFTKMWGLRRLVWFEWHSDIHAAIHREKQIKRWRRQWKFALIEEDAARAGVLGGPG